MIFKNFSDSERLVVSEVWKKWPKEERLFNLNKITSESRFENYFTCVRAEKNGEVYVIFSSPVQVNQRGTLLLDFEEYLKNELDFGITVWCEPLGDKNSLRNLRGIEIKTRGDSFEV